MDISTIILIITCAFSGISIMVSVINLMVTKNISQDERYINTITSSRKDWEDGIKSNSSSYFSLLDSIFLYHKEVAISKYEELLKCEYAIEITLYNYDDDIEIKVKMKEIREIIHSYLVSNEEKLVMRIWQ